MNLTQKYLACTALALSSVFATSVAADTSTSDLKPSDVTSATLKHYVFSYNLTFAASEARYNYLLNLQAQATSQNNEELLTLTDMAIDELGYRVLNTCFPLYTDAMKATLEEDQAIEAQTQSTVSDAYKALHQQFLHECSAEVFPNVVIPQTGPQAGNILSDVTLDRAALLQWGNHFIFSAQTQLEESQAYLDQHRSTSGRAYIRRMNEHLDSSIKVAQSCATRSQNYRALVASSNDLLEIRREKAKFSFACNQKVTF